MIDAILSSLGGPQAPFPWLVVLAFAVFVIAYGLFETGLGYGARSLWRWATRPGRRAKKRPPRRTAVKVLGEDA